MSNDAKGKRRASGRGTTGGASPLTMREISQPDGRNGATLAIYADERNPCLWAIRNGRTVSSEMPRSVVMQDGRNWLTRPTQKGRCLPDRFPARIRITPQRIRRQRGSYGLLSHHRLELGTPTPPCPEMGRENASAWNGGRRRRSSPTLGCNGRDTVKVRQGKLVQRQANGYRTESR
jgi:hypothetical protein